MSHILVDQNGAPVPLPFHTVDFRGDPVTVTDFTPGRTPGSTGRIYTDKGYAFYPSVCDLKIISEADFMAKQQQTRRLIHVS